MPIWLSTILGSGVIDKILSFIPNPAEKEAARLQWQSAILEAALKADADQRDINKTEAASASMFVAGWRPAVGWLCVIVLAADWLFYPLANWFSVLFGFFLPVMPTLGNQDTQALLWALLGIGSLRTVEKVTGAPMTKKIVSGLSGVFS